MNKAIFLDVDGVLNNGIWAIEMFDKGIRVYHDDLLYDDYGMGFSYGFI